MTDEQPVPDRLLVYVERPVAYVRIEGRGSFHISPALKDFGVAAFEHGARRLVLDFSACVGMDSTFMGVIAGLAFRYAQQGGGRVTAINLSSRTHHLLSTLGLNRIIETRLAGKFIPSAEESPPPEQLRPADTGSRSREELTRTMIEAHEDLIRTSTANLPKFKDVLAFLREDLQRQMSGRSPA